MEYVHRKFTYIISHRCYTEQVWYRSQTTTTRFMTPPRKQREPSSTTGLCLHSFARRFGYVLRNRYAQRIHRDLHTNSTPLHRSHLEQVLVAHAAEVTSPNASAKVNFFKTSLGNGTRSYAAPVMLAGPSTTAVDVTLRCDGSTSGQVSVGCGDIPKERLVASVLHPGVEPSSLTVTWGNTGELVFNKLPLHRGCAMIVLRDSADPPPPPVPPPLPPLPPPPSPPARDCTAGCKLEMVPCNNSSSSQRFTYDGKHLHNQATNACVDMNKASLAVLLWSPCATVTDDDQWWSFAYKNQTSGALSGIVQMKGVPSPILHVISACRICM